MELPSSELEYVRHLKAEKISILLEIKSTEEKLKQLQDRSNELDKNLDLVTQELQKNEKVKAINILDIPVLVWNDITALTSDSDEDLINQCLASPVLDDIIPKSRFVGRKEYLIADEVFSILVQNQYLDKNDLHNCVSLNARNDAIEMAALRTWRFCSENSHEENRRLTLRFGSKEMVVFERNVDSQGNYSKMFMGKTFEIIYYSSEDKNGTYWKNARRFVRKYKRYILRVSVYVVDNNHGIALGSRFSCFCLKTLDRLQYLCCKDNGGGISRKDQIDSSKLHERIDARTRRRYFEINTDEPCVYNNPLFKLAAPILELWILKDANPNTGSIKLNKLKALDVPLWKPVMCGEFLRSESPQRLGTVEKLCFAYLPLANFKESEIPSWIESVTDLQLLVYSLRYQESVSWGPWKPVLPNVKKLTLNFHSVSDNCPPLAPFVASMKSLKRITLKIGRNKKQLLAALQRCFDEGLIEDDADIYELYGKGRSLKESNIWKMASGLNCLTMDTWCEVDTQDLRNVEKYMRSRITGNVELHEYQLLTTKH